MIMAADDPNQPLSVAPGEPATLDPGALAPLGLASRIQVVQAVLTMAASQADTLLSLPPQMQGAYRDMAERMRPAPRPDAVLRLQAWLDSLQNELDWLEAKHPLFDTRIDIGTLQARLAIDRDGLLNLIQEAEQALEIAGQIASALDEVGSLTSHVPAISNTKRRSEALLATATRLSS